MTNGLVAYLGNGHRTDVDDDVTEHRSVSIDEVSRSVLSLIPRSVALRYDVVPLRIDETRNRFVIAIPDTGAALSAEARHELETRSKAKLAFVRAPLENIVALHDALYADVRDDDDSIAWFGILTSAIAAAVRRGADDVIIAKRGALGGQIIIHADGRGIVHEDIGIVALRHVQRATLARAHVPGGDDLSRAHRGRLSVTVEGHERDLRAIYLPMEDEAGLLSLRIHADFERFARLTDILPQKLYKRFWDSISAFKQQMVITSGPPGQGKSTLMRAALHQFYRLTNDPLLVSLERTIETRLPWLMQIGVGEDSTLTMEAAIAQLTGVPLTGAFFGEIVLKQEIADAMGLAFKGIPVFATTHGDTAPQTVWRLMNDGADPYQLGQVLASILGQRLLARLCPHCRIPTSEAPAHDAGRHAAAVASWRSVIGCYGSDTLEAAFANATLYTANAEGCAACIRGYLGRIPTFDLLIVNDNVRRQIYRRATADEIAAADPDYEPMWVYTAELLCNGETSPEEALRAMTLPQVLA